MKRLWLVESLILSRVYNCSRGSCTTQLDIVRVFRGMNEIRRTVRVLLRAFLDHFIECRYGFGCLLKVGQTCDWTFVKDKTISAHNLLHLVLDLFKYPLIWIRSIMMAYNNGWLINKIFFFNMNLWHWIFLYRTDFWLFN